MIAFRRTFLVTVFVFALSAPVLRAQGFTPEEALKRMKVADGFEVKLVASEPAIRQPVTMTFDERGRLWVIQYLQYPTPAGLKPVKVDQYLRTVYDRRPEPPPHGPRGADRITILEDPDANGRYRKAKDFVTGLNLASGLCLGNGGVYVLQTPYLLFYPDRDGDDKPDGPPEVLLTGFGMEDAHAVANSLQWGPDGWLYGAHGSTVTAKIRGIEFQQGIWRYHPKSKRFELFSEGGGNTWGLDFDENGQVIAGTNWGGFAMLHQVQGGYYIKGFSKHGPLHNPHTYGYFDHVPYQRFKGGHVTCGGIVYQGSAYPDKLRNVYIAGNLLSSSLYWHILERRGSSFVSRFGGDFLVANDTWFRPIDCLIGPDGAVYVADWYDKRANHVDPVDNWDRTNGRIYKIVAQGERGRFSAPRELPRGANATPLAKMSSKELIALLDHPNVWQRREARRILGERRDASVLPALCKAITDNEGRLALESLWALYVSGGFDETLAEKLLDHKNEHIRAWTVRLLGDDNRVSVSLRKQLIAVAKRETSSVVRSQLACSCKRLPAADGLPLVRELLRHSEDVGDPHIPLLLWWAIEDKAIAHRDRVLALLDTPDAWQLPLVKRFLLERLGRRYLAEGGKADLETCVRLLEKAPGADERNLLLSGMDKALEGRVLANAQPLTETIVRLWQQTPDAPVLLRLAVRLAEPKAYAHLLKRIANTQVAESERAALVELLGQVGKSDCVALLLELLAAAKTDALRGGVLSALQPFPDERIAARVLALYPRLSSSLRARAQSLLASRPASGLALLRAVDAGRIVPRDVPLDRLQRLTTYKDKRIAELIAKHWGAIAPATAGEKISRIRSLNSIVARGKGNAANGRLLFQKNCATCHTLFGEGNKVGPDLTTADRKNREYLIAQIVDPNAIIRADYQAFTIETKDGRSLFGLVVENTPGAVTLVDSKNERITIARSKIEEMTPSATSLMPEKILDPLSDEELCDLFRYLQGDAIQRGR